MFIYQALDTYMLKYQKRLREEIKSMRELQESLSSSSLNDKMDKDCLSDDDSMGMTNSHDQAVARIIEVLCLLKEIFGATLEELYKKNAKIMA
ncbi:hypothetical protein E2C01_096011 [Portunus trituberculatus]|uniref:Uncharacterized protein n=1 Tax=Portunus trituberculatus TaxID=210409 RepID=A0A5B7K752_PORTR|nr:hypothetical protein [Portunus trituberculatus]